VTAIHCPGAPPGYPPRGSICRHDCTGPFATRAGDVTCRRCLARGAQAITKAFVVPIWETGQVRRERSGR